MEIYSTPISDVFYRRATDKDSVHIRELIFGILRAYGLNTDQIETDMDLFEIEKYYPEGHFWVLINHQSEIKGSFALYHPGGHTVEIRRMYFDPSLRGVGLGKWALKFLEDTAINLSYKTLWLETTSKLMEAIELYKKAGFIYTESSCHSSRCDVVMEKNMS